MEREERRKRRGGRRENTWCEMRERVGPGGMEGGKKGDGRGCTRKQNSVRRKKVIKKRRVKYYGDI